MSTKPGGAPLGVAQKPKERKETLTSDSGQQAEGKPGQQAEGKPVPRGVPGTHRYYLHHIPLCAPLYAVPLQCPNAALQGALHITLCPTLH